MFIKHVVELPDGNVNFQGVLEGPELAIIIEAGINTLFQEGALPFLSEKHTKNLVPPADLSQ